MKCHNCDKTFDYRDELNFCPFCGFELNIEKKVNLGNTLDMPLITDRDIRNRMNKQRAEKLFKSAKAIILNPKIAATIITVFALVVLSVWAYRYYFYGAVDVDKLKVDLNGKTISLAKNHPFTIKENYIKNVKVISSKKAKGKKGKNILLEMELNNEQLDVEGKVNLHYIYEGKDKWALDNNISFKLDSVLPAAGMKEKQLIEQLRESDVVIADKEISLEDRSLKSIQIVNSKIQLKEKRESLKAKVILDNGIQNAEGQLDIIAAFKNYKWQIVTVKQPSEFETTLSANFSYSTILNNIKNTSLEGNYVYSTVFNKEPFYIPSGTDESVKIVDKAYDAQDNQLKVSVERTAQAGELRVVFTEEYTYQLSFDNIEKVSEEEKPAITSAKVGKIDESKFQKLIEGAEIAGKRKFFLWNDTYSITEAEADSFKIEKVSYIRGSMNEQYVTGKITLNIDGEDKEENAAAKVYLRYNEGTGYMWCLDKIVTEDSPEYEDFQ